MITIRHRYIAFKILIPLETVSFPSQKCRPKIDIRRPQITLNRMTLLQTRVEDKIAVRFRQVARARGLKPYAYLQQLVADAAKTPPSNTWENHWQRIAKMKLKTLDYGAVERDREDER